MRKPKGLKEYGSLDTRPLKSEIGRRQTGLSDDRACCANGKFFFGMRDDGSAPINVPIFRMAALL